MTALELDELGAFFQLTPEENVLVGEGLALKTLAEATLSAYTAALMPTRKLLFAGLVANLPITHLEASLGAPRVFTQILTFFTAVHAL